MWSSSFLFVSIRSSPLPGFLREFLLFSVQIIAVVCIPPPQRGHRRGQRSYLASCADLLVSFPVPVLFPSGSIENVLAFLLCVCFHYVLSPSPHMTKYSFARPPPLSRAQFMASAHSSVACLLQIFALTPIQDSISPFLVDDLYLVFLRSSCRLAVALSPGTRRFHLGLEDGNWRYRQVRLLEEWPCPE